MSSIGKGWDMHNKFWRVQVIKNSMDSFACEWWQWNILDSFGVEYILEEIKTKL